ncbi:MAG: exopolyphosphatase, partial [Hyphomicrobiales bacterium]
MKVNHRIEPVRRPHFEPVAIVDIGSNSVRLVVYDGLRRSPAPIFNEKLLCGLGKGVATTGKLPEAGVERALSALSRFKLLCMQIGASQVHAVATAAAREAENGPKFIKLANDALGEKITVLSGKKEARYAAMGILAGFPQADGLVGDLGGGSLEIVDVRDGQIGDGITLPLGPLRLRDMAATSPLDAEQIVNDALSNAHVLQNLRGRKFYAVGGGWRNLARLHMAQTQYPLRVLHDYKIERRAARSLAGLVAGLSVETLKEINAVSSNRAETLPLGSMVLDRLLAIGQPNQMVLSAYGLREGLL